MTWNGIPVSPTAGESGSPGYKDFLLRYSPFFFCSIIQMTFQWLVPGESNLKTKLRSVPPRAVGEPVGGKRDPQSFRGKFVNPNPSPAAWGMDAGGHVLLHKAQAASAGAPRGLPSACPMGARLSVSGWSTGLCVRPSPLYWPVCWTRMNLKLPLLHFPISKIDLIICPPL